jgi:hypothetical protein
MTALSSQVIGSMEACERSNCQAPLAHPSSIPAPLARNLLCLLDISLTQPGTFDHGGSVAPHDRRG